MDFRIFMSRIISVWTVLHIWPTASICWPHTVNSPQLIPTTLSFILQNTHWNEKTTFKVDVFDSMHTWKTLRLYQKIQLSSLSVEIFLSNDLSLQTKSRPRAELPFYVSKKHCVKPFKGRKMKLRSCFLYWKTYFPLSAARPLNQIFKASTGLLKLNLSYPDAPSQWPLSVWNSQVKSITVSRQTRGAWWGHPRSHRKTILS